MHLQGSKAKVASWFHHAPQRQEWESAAQRYPVRCSNPYVKALALVPYFMHLAGLKWHEY